MSKNKRHSYILLIALLVFTLVPATAFAEGGDGNGQGLGLNRDVALTLEKSSIAANAANVPLNPTIQLDFNKNICNVTELANNKKCFHLTDADGNAVAIKLVFPDNQVQQDYKQEAFLIPLEDLEPDTSYQVAVDSTLQAKNGTTIDNAHTFTFTTGSKRTKQENPVLKKLGENIIAYETAYPETADSVPVDKTGPEDITEGQKPDTGSIASIAAIILILLVVVFTAILLILKRRKG